MATITKQELFKRMLEGKTGILEYFALLKGIESINYKPIACNLEDLKGLPKLKGDGWYDLAPKDVDATTKSVETTNRCTYKDGMHRCTEDPDNKCKGWMPSSKDPQQCMYLRKDIDNACDNSSLHYKRG